VLERCIKDLSDLLYEIQRTNYVRAMVDEKIYVAGGRQVVMTPDASPSAISTAVAYATVSDDRPPVRSHNKYTPPPPSVLVSHDGKELPALPTTDAAHIAYRLSILNNDKAPNTVGLPPVQAQRYFAQLIQAVLDMHTHDICHRDLSLENILIDDDDNIKLCDFGQAVKCPRDRSIIETSKDPEERKKRIGKPANVAFEVLNQEYYDPRAVDAFSCGCILFAMLIGTRPFVVATNVDPVFRKVVEQDDLDGLLQGWTRNISDDAFEVLRALLAPIEYRKTIVDVCKMKYVELALNNVVHARHTGVEIIQPFADGPVSQPQNVPQNNQHARPPS